MHRGGGGGVINYNIHIYIIKYRNLINVNMQLFLSLIQKIDKFNVSHDRDPSISEWVADQSQENLLGVTPTGALAWPIGEGSLPARQCRNFWWTLSPH